MTSNLDQNNILIEIPRCDLLLMCLICLLQNWHMQGSKDSSAKWFKMGIGYTSNLSGNVLSEVHGEILILQCAVAHWHMYHIFNL
jgi:hypothetical protein